MIPHRDRLVGAALLTALLTSAACVGDGLYLRVESDAPAQILEIDRDGVLTWSNTVAPNRFYLSASRALHGVDGWHRLLYGETTNRVSTTKVPLSNPLVLVGANAPVTALWLGRPWDGGCVPIKSAGGLVGAASISADEAHVLYTEELALGGSDYAVKDYAVRSATTTTLVDHAGRLAAFDPRDPRYCFYLDGLGQTIHRRALAGGDDQPWVTDEGRPIRSFLPSPNGGRIMVLSGEADPLSGKRLTTFTGDGHLERVLWEGAFDVYGIAFHAAGNQAVVAYRSGDCDGRRHITVYDLATGAGRDWPDAITKGWPVSPCAPLTIAWAPYDEVIALAGGDFFCSPLDGQITGTHAAPPGYTLLGIGSDARWYVTDVFLTHLLRLERNP